MANTATAHEDSGSFGYFGYDSGVINGTVDGLQKAFNSSAVGTGQSVAVMLLGSAVGAFFAGTLADKFGRKYVLIFAAVLFIISAWGSGVANSTSSFVIYRIIGGLAVGAASVMAARAMTCLKVCQTSLKGVKFARSFGSVSALPFSNSLSVLTLYFIMVLSCGKPSALQKMTLC